jgi:hypothetical protein
MNEDDIMIEDDAIALEDSDDTSISDADVSNIIPFIMERYKRSEDYRYQDEERWLKAYRNYRGLYGPDVQFTESEKSRVFIKVTKTKTLAAYGQIVDVLFANQRFPLSVEPTELPEGVVADVHFDPQEPEQLREGQGTSPYGFAGDGKDLPPGATAQTLQEKLGVMQNKLEPISDKLKEGPGRTPTSIAFKTIPQVNHVSVWNFYPDPDANNMDEAQFVVERHKMSRTQLRNLKKRPYFRGEVINEVISMGENYTKKYWEDDLSDYAPEHGIDRFEVLEYWGMVDVELLEEQNIDIPKELRDFDELQANVWICNGRLLRMVLNPFKPSKIPYSASPYELNPYSFFGVGIAENMDDTQTLMNGFMRMAVDNAVLSGNLIVEVDETNLVPGQDLSLYPGKVFRRQGGAPGQAIFGTKFPNVSQENMMLFDKARVLADESTGFPSFAHGQTGVSGVGRTASGISMLMGAAQGSTKTIIKNVDDYLLRPLGEGFFRFNMQFDFDPEIKGDLEVKARGTESLMANEVRSQRLMQFLQIASNPALAPFAKFQYVIREIAKSMELDPDKVTNNMDEAALQAEIMKGFQQPAGPEQGGMMPPAGANAMDPTGAGGGNIGTGQVPVPGEQGFSANGQGNIQQAEAAGQQQPPMGPLQ